MELRPESPTALYNSRRRTTLTTRLCSDSVKFEYLLRDEICAFLKNPSTYSYLDFEDYDLNKIPIVLNLSTSALFNQQAQILKNKTIDLDREKSEENTSTFCLTQTNFNDILAFLNKFNNIHNHIQIDTLILDGQNWRFCRDFITQMISAFNNNNYIRKLSLIKTENFSLNEYTDIMMNIKCSAHIISPASSCKNHSMNVDLSPLFHKEVIVVILDHIEHFSVNSLKSIQLPTSLEILSLRCNNISTFDGLILREFLSGNNANNNTFNLRKLSLSFNTLSDHGIIYISQAIIGFDQRYPQLTMVQFGGNSISESVAISLLASIAKSTTWWMSFDFSPMDADHDKKLILNILNKNRLEEEKGVYNDYFEIVLDRGKEVLELLDRQAIFATGLRKAMISYSNRIDYFLSFFQRHIWIYSVSSDIHNKQQQQQGHSEFLLTPLSIRDCLDWVENRDCFITEKHHVLFLIKDFLSGPEIMVNAMYIHFQYAIRRLIRLSPIPIVFALAIYLEYHENIRSDALIDEFIEEKEFLTQYILNMLYELDIEAFKILSSNVEKFLKLLQISDNGKVLIHPRVDNLITDTWQKRILYPNLVNVSKLFYWWLRHVCHIDRHNTTSGQDGASILGLYSYLVLNPRTVFLSRMLSILSFVILTLFTVNPSEQFSVSDSVNRNSRSFDESATSLGIEGVLYILYCSSFMIDEYRQLNALKWNLYVSSFWNILDAMNCFIFMPMVFLTFMGIIDSLVVQEHLMAVILAIQVLRLMDILGLSESLGPLVQAFGLMMKNVLQFFIMEAFVIIGFDLLFIIILSAEKDSNISADNLQIKEEMESFSKCLLALISLSVQSNVDSVFFLGIELWGFGHPTFIIASLFFLFISGILMLNLLIAIMNDTYSAVQSRSYSEYKKALLRTHNEISAMHGLDLVLPPFSIIYFPCYNMFRYIIPFIHSFLTVQSIQFFNIYKGNSTNREQRIFIMSNIYYKWRNIEKRIAFYLVNFTVFLSILPILVFFFIILCPFRFITFVLNICQKCQKRKIFLVLIGGFLNLFIFYPVSFWYNIFTILFVPFSRFCCGFRGGFELFISPLEKSIYTEEHFKIYPELMDTDDVYRRRDIDEFIQIISNFLSTISKDDDVAYNKWVNQVEPCLHMFLANRNLPDVLTNFRSSLSSKELFIIGLNDLMVSIECFGFNIPALSWHSETHTLNKTKNALRNIGDVYSLLKK